VTLAVHGVVARWELLEEGFSPGLIGSLVRDGSLWVVHRGVYAVGRPALTRRGRWRAAVLVCGRGAALSHRSAAALHRLRAGNRARMEVVVPHRGTHRAAGIDIHLTRNLHPDDVMVVDDVPCTTVERTLLDLADVLRFSDLERVAETAYRLRALRVEHLHRQLNAPGRRRRKLARALRVKARDTRSPHEREFLGLVAKTGLPQPLENVWFPGFEFEVDVLWPTARLVVEIDSSYHDTPHARERDARKDALLRGAGHTVVRIRRPQFASFIAGELPARLGVTS
jgi:hypothetical protein